jgi:hypothetical protein
VTDTEAWTGSALAVNRFVDPRDDTDWGSDRDPVWDLLIASVGYETRARFVSQELTGFCARVMAWTFEDHRELSFDRNLSFFQKIGAIVLDESEVAFRKSLLQTLLDDMDTHPSAPGSVFRLAADISSMTRQRVAHLMQTCLVQLPTLTGRDCQLTLLYAPAHYSPAVGTEGPIRVSEPIRGFEGWAIEPEKPSVCVIGLGFEHQLALAAIEQLEPAETWLFLPEGVDERYDAQLLACNSYLLNDVPPHRVIRYDVESPYVTYLRLESLLAELSVDSRPVVVPLGPKVFAALALTSALTHQPEITVWRLSADVAREAIDRQPVGHIVGLTISTEPSDVTA